MTAQGSLQLILYIVLLTAAAKPLGLFMTAVYEGRRTWLTPVFGWLERGIYRVGGIDERSESTAGVASVGRRRRPTEMPRKRDLHRCQPTDYTRFVTGRRKP